MRRTKPITQLALPLLGVFAIIIILGVVRGWVNAKRFGGHRNAYEQQRARDQRAQQQRAQNQRSSSSYSTNQRSNNNVDVIDAEFTEEEIVD